jgi:hypothetical protein
MPPRDRGQRRPLAPSGQDTNELLPWAIVYYQAPDGTVPALEFLDDCPGTIDAQFTAVLDAVAAAPPPRFSGGGKWEGMHGTMGGWYEIRLTGPGREQLRLFCLLENGTSEELARRGLPRPAIACGNSEIRANDHRLQDSPGHSRPRSPQLDGTSGHF